MYVRSEKSEFRLQWKPLDNAAVCDARVSQDVEHIGGSMYCQSGVVDFFFNCSYICWESNYMFFIVAMLSLYHSVLIVKPVPKK